MRRTVMAVVLVGVLAGVALWLFPVRGGDAALADVARAMSDVTSAHFVGWSLDRATGQQRLVEGWIKGDSKLRLIQEGASDLDTADNGEMTVTLRNYNGVNTAWVEPPGRLAFVESGMSYLDLFVGGQGLTSNLEINGYMVESVSDGALRDGCPATMVELRHMEGGKAVLVVDADSNLVTQWQVYDRSGTLVKSVDSIDYNVDTPDSTFILTIPEGTPVIDHLTPESLDIVAWHEGESERLATAGGERLGKMQTGMCGTPYHDGLHFQSMNNNGIVLFYFRGRNAYHVVGRALVIMLDGASHQVIENAEIPAPGAPDFSRAEAPLPVNPRLEGAEERLKRAGGRMLLKVREGGGRCGSPYHSKLHFQMLRYDGCLIFYMPDRNAYHVVGKVRVFGMGLDTVVEDGEIQAPGPPDRTEE